MFLETILLAFGFDRLAGEYRSNINPIAYCWLRHMSVQTRTGLRLVSFFSFLFFL